MAATVEQFTYPVVQGCTSSVLGQLLVALALQHMWLLSYTSDHERNDVQSDEQSTSVTLPCGACVTLRGAFEY